jgi:hypothetical protein
MIDWDHVVDLADRAAAAMRRGEELGPAFDLELAGLTGEELDAYTALFNQRSAAALEQGERITDGSAAAKAVHVLHMQKAPELTLGQALDSGRIELIELIEAIRSASS